MAEAGYCFGEFRRPETQSGYPVREHREASLLRWVIEYLFGPESVQVVIGENGADKDRSHRLRSGLEGYENFFQF